MRFQLFLRTHWPALTLLLILASACQREPEQETGRPESTGQAPTEAGGVFTEPQAVQILLAIDRARLSGAQAVGAKSENEVVLQYAQVMKADHAAMSALLDSLMSKTGQAPAENNISRQFIDGAQLFAMELTQRDTGINNSYLANEVRDHERALQLLQGALIPSAKSPEVKAMFEQLVPAYHAHLQRAREILQARMSGNRAAPIISSTPSHRPSGTDRAAAPASSADRPDTSERTTPKPDPDPPPQPEPPKLLGRPIGN